MTKIKIILSLILVFALFACDNSQTATQSAVPGTAKQPTNKVVLASEVNWTPLNPARGDQSPQAGTLWGDRTSEVATGFLVKFKEGFSSPPHIHNVTYRGVVINGLVHNDDPNAEKMWMPAGSFWMQPAGEAHVTAAKGSENMAFIEIEEGPYLVRPTEQAFDNGERPLNVDKSNIVWVDLPEQSAPSNSNNVKIVYLWDYPNAKGLRGMLVKLNAGFLGKIESEGPDFRAVVIQGKPQYHMADNGETKILEAGSYFTSEGKATHHISSGANEESILYIRTEGVFDIVSTQ